jgi:hypothetical protein
LTFVNGCCIFAARCADRSALRTHSV